MIILLWLFVVIAVGKAFGGQISKLAQLKLRAVWALPIITAVQLLGFTLHQPLPWLSPVLVITSYLALLLLGWLNRRIAGMPLILVGLALNFAVISANGGTMPITREALEAIGRTQNLVAAPPANNEPSSLTVAGSKDSVRSEAPLLFLGDVIIIPLPGRLASAISLGDLWLASGITCLVIAVMRVPLFSKASIIPR